MKFEQFLNEMPALMKDNPYKESWNKAYISSLADIKKGYPLIKTLKMGKYDIKVYKIATSEYTSILELDGMPKASIETYEEDYGMSVLWVVKDPKLESKNIYDLYLKIMTDLSKHGNIYSGMSQTKGSQTLWKNLMKYADKLNHKIGIFNLESDEKDYKDIDNFNDWYDDIVDEAYRGEEVLLFIEK